jgi:hypothetical protein
MNENRVDIEQVSKGVCSGCDFPLESKSPIDKLYRFNFHNWTKDGDPVTPVNFCPVCITVAVVGMFFDPSGAPKRFIEAFDKWAASPDRCSGQLFDQMLELRGEFPWHERENHVTDENES